jgi:hypothetical protein
MHVFKHPKYYKELRKLRNKSDQAISDSPESRVRDSVRPDPGHKLQAREDSTANSTRGQVAEPQASSAKLTKQQAASVKPRGTSIKLQAASVKLQDS